MFIYTAGTIIEGVFIVFLLVLFGGIIISEKLRERRIKKEKK